MSTSTKDTVATWIAAAPWLMMLAGGAVFGALEMLGIVSR
jgi:hypothetical protein